MMSGDVDEEPLLISRNTLGSGEARDSRSQMQGLRKKWWRNNVEEMAEKEKFWGENAVSSELLGRPDRVGRPASGRSAALGRPEPAGSTG